MIYRSPWTRWLLAAVGIVTGLVLIFGDTAKWRSTPSLQWLAQAPIPLQAWGVALVVYGVLLLFDSTRPAGYAAGAVIWSVFGISLIATLDEPGPKSIVAVGALVDTVVFHMFSIRTAWTQRLST